MRIGLLISAALHALLLALAIVGLGAARRELKPVEPEPVAVDIITESELTKLKQGSRRAREPEAEAKKTNISETLKEPPPKPKVAVVTPPPPPPAPPQPEVTKKILEEMKTAEPKPIEKAPEPKSVEPEKKPEPPRPEPTPKAEEVLEAMKSNEPKPVEKKAEPPKAVPPKVVKKPPPPKPAPPKQVAVATPPSNKSFDINDPDALNKLLLDKNPNRRPPAPSATETQSQRTPSKPTLGAPDGKDQQISASEIAALGAIIKRRIREQGCWGVQGGGIDADRISVKLRVKFSETGGIVGQPQVMNHDASKAFQVAAENAVRAVLDCAPYPLPPDRYAVWQDMILNFVPRDM
jgi:colicin import membrane protein